MASSDAKARLEALDAVFGGLPVRFSSFQWHSYAFELPRGAVALARNERCLQAFRAGESAWGIQFHAEVLAADVERWFAEYVEDDKGPAAGLDPEALRAETLPRMSAWSDLGRALCGRFLAAAARPLGAPR